jgi:hypothetical protein
VIVTHDADFLRMDAAGAIHAGIVYLRPEKHSLGEMIRLLVLDGSFWDRMRYAGTSSIYDSAGRLADARVAAPSGASHPGPASR